MTIEQASCDCDLDILGEALARPLREQSGESVKSIKVLHHVPRPYSVVSFLEISTDLRAFRLVLKRYINHPLNAGTVQVSEQALVEYDILARLYPTFSTVDGCSVPRPIAVVPELNALVMEHVEGHVLDQDLRFVHYLASRARFRELQKRLYLCGQWLRHFQDFTGPRLACTDSLEGILAHCGDRLRVIERSGDRRCPRGFRKTATTFLERQVEALSKTEILVTGRHSDFGPWNTLADPRGVTVIDFFGFREAPLPVDILSMLVFLESISLGIANSAVRIRILRERFLAGLGPLPEVPQPLVLLCEGQQRVMGIAGTVIARGENVFQRLERRRSLRANVSWFHTCPETSSLWPS